MSEAGYCNGGGLNGISVKEDEMVAYAKKFNLKHIDEFIPLPTNQPYPNTCKQDHNNPENSVYWETEQGSHGCCCDLCGKVTQWG